MTTKKEKTSTIAYSFGDVTFKVWVEGKVDRPDQILDHMTTTAISTFGLEAVQNALGEIQSSGTTRQTCKDTTEIGDIKVYSEISIDSSTRISLRKLNAILFGAVLPNLKKTAALYFGDNHWEATPMEPLNGRSIGESLHDLEASLSLTHPIRSQTTEYDMPQQHSSHRQLQHA